MALYRLKLVSTITSILAAVIVARLFYWQIIRGDWLAAQAAKQHQDTIRLSGERGEILDAQGNLLAGTDNLYHLYVYKPSLDKQENKLAQLLAEILAPDPPLATQEGQPRLSHQDMVEQTQDYLIQRLNLDANWVSLKHYLNFEQKEAINNLAIKGLGFEDEFTRFYPEASLSAHLLGFVGKDQVGQSKGYFGLEGFFDRQLQGRDGQLRLDKDVTGRPILIGRYQEISASRGRSLGTTINRNLQYLTESLLADALETYQATAGGIIVMESKTGKIRAMASLPAYDPASFSDSDPALFKNPNVADLFEPGSTFKVLVMAAALNEAVIEPDTVCNICAGPVTIGEYSVRTWNDVYHPNTTMTETIVHSDNTGMVFAINRLGKQKALDYFSQFGLFEKTDIQLQEETSSPPKAANQIYDIDLATMSFGQGIAITPIQLVTAVNAIANQGILVKPTLADRLISGSKVIALNPPQTRPVISAQTAQKITQMMIEAANEGEAKWAIPDNITIAGKTGTAQIPIKGHYDEDKTIASFVGFFPAHDPQYTMLVTLKEPQSSPWGSETAAPLWFKLAKQLLLLASPSHD